MRNGAHLLCVLLNHRKWLPVHLLEHRQRCQIELLSGGQIHAHFVCRRCHHLPSSKTLNVTPISGVFCPTPCSLFAVVLTQIICSVSLIPPPKQKNPLHRWKPNHKNHRSNYNSAFSNSELPNLSAKCEQSPCTPD